MTDTKWFVSYKTYTLRVGLEDSIITDITPARWLLCNDTSIDVKRVILYAEEISPSLAAELIHAAGIKAHYFKEVE